MKETGVIRRIDELGRVVIPKEVRKKLKIREGDLLDIYLNGTNIILQKYSLLNDLVVVLQTLLDSIKKTYDVEAIITDMEKVIASTKINVLPTDKITTAYVNLFSKNEELRLNVNSIPNITDNFKSEADIICKPISLYHDLFGSIILFIDNFINNKYQEIMSFIHRFIIDYMET